jgi:hypothetical protein
MPAGRICATTLLPVFVNCFCFGQQKTYDIYRATSPIVIDARLNESAWQQAPSVGDFHFPHFKDGVREQTVAKILWDDDNLYVSWLAHDKHISAFITQRHGPVSKDDCVEIFIAPNPDKIRNYYTFEINAIGTMLNRARTDWWNGPPHMGTRGSSISRFVPGRIEKGGVLRGRPLDRRGSDSAEELRPRCSAYSAARRRSLAPEPAKAGRHYQCSSEYLVTAAVRCPELSYSGSVWFGAFCQQCSTASEGANSWYGRD